jgi:hypothetical protein
MAVAREIADKPLDLFTTSFRRTARANPEATARLPSDAIGELLSDVGGVLVVGAGNCGSQPTEGFAVAGGMMSIRGPAALCGPASLRPPPATLFLDRALCAEEPFFFLGREPVRAARVVEIVGL